MSLQFYFGASGAGKSKKLHSDILEEAGRRPNVNYLFVVPDQFTMQTQKDLVTESPNHVIMNVDVLSFGRLTHRIMEEVGGDDRPVLDDTGKSLILRKVAQQQKDNLEVMGSRMNRIGYIHEVKSALSEFMQYGIGVDELSKLLAYSEKRGALYHKLKDLKTLYAAFLTYISEHYITSEETLDLLCHLLPKSEIVKDSVIIFDGFTGFTPIQNRVIKELMRCSSKVIMALTIDERENPYCLDGEQKLFYLTKKTVYDMRRLMTDVGIHEEQAVYCTKRINGRLPRFANSEELGHLESNLFRYPARVYEKTPEHIHLFLASTPKEEIRQTCIAIKKLLIQSLTRKEGSLHYRDIAVVTGNMEAYGDEMTEEFAHFGIPAYLDVSGDILGNPFIEFIRSALQIVLQNFSADAVFRYMRTGLTGFLREDIDRLENYVRRFGIKGRNKWASLFVYKEKREQSDREENEEQVAQLERFNKIREQLLWQLEPLFGKCTVVGEWVKALYEVMVRCGLEQKLSEKARCFREQQDQKREKEYAQIYSVVVDLLDQIYGLLEKEEMSCKDFADILDAGFAEINIGAIPQNVDQIVIGDIERTRLKQVKVLFFLGVNDGNIPKNASKGGIISDIDREFLTGSGFELAPTPRQQMYIQRLYLYLNMTKPSEELFMSYSRIGNDGKSMRPAYLIDSMKELYPKLEVTEPEREPALLQLVNGQDGFYFIAQMLREYAGGRMDTEEEAELFALFDHYHTKEPYCQETAKLVETAFFRYSQLPLSKLVVKALYGSTLCNSVSRLEQYAACAYAHFLKYGLRLKERGDYQFENTDLGNIFHAVLEVFSARLSDKGYTWFDFPIDKAEELVEEALIECASDYDANILFSTARNRHLMKRIMRVLRRTVVTLQYQLKKGSFMPDQFEMSFSNLENINALNVALSENEKMRLRGRIDRVDTYEAEEKVYVKVIDYKSGNQKFDLAALYYGLQLQLVVYMNAAVEAQQRKHPDKEVVPAAMLYYHVADPMIEAGDNLTEEQINQMLIRELKMNGVVNADAEVIRHLDSEFETKSDVYPLERKKDGSFKAGSGIMDEESMKAVSRFVHYKIKSLGKGILSGDIAINPYEQGNDKACTFCSYKKICGFDKRLDGYEMRTLKKMSEEDVMSCIREELEEN